MAGKRFAICVLGAALLSGAVSGVEAAPVLVLNNDLIYSALGVEVNGASYNVDFLIGNCSSVFGDCSVGAIFPFTTAGTAQAASQALLDTVLIDGDPAFAELQYDRFPYLTNGCGGSFISRLDCEIITPYAVGPNAAGGPLLYAVVARNGSAVGAADAVGLGSAIADLAAVPDAGTLGSGFTWARWRLASTDTVTVPAPATSGLLAAGLIFARLMRGRRR